MFIGGQSTGARAVIANGIGPKDIVRLGSGAVNGVRRRYGGTQSDAGSGSADGAEQQLGRPVERAATRSSDIDLKTAEDGIGENVLHDDEVDLINRG